MLRGEDTLSFVNCVKTASLVAQTRLDAASLTINEEVNASFRAPANKTTNDIRRKKDKRCYNCESTNHYARECTSLCRECLHNHAAKDCFKRQRNQENLNGTSSNFLFEILHKPLVVPDWPCHSQPT